MDVPTDVLQCIVLCPVISCYLFAVLAFAVSGILALLCLQPAALPQMGRDDALARVAYSV
jgi:hypothetical protein